MADNTRRWSDLAIVAVAAAATLVAVDAALHRVVPPKPLLEVDEAVARYEAGDPTTLVLGSSHARSFVTLGRVVAERTGGAERVQPVPVEWGKYTPYRWVLDNRLKPLIEETDATGRRVRPSLKRAILVTEWWDSTVLDGGNGSITMALPARAWQWKHFWADLLQNNLTPYNQNFLQRVWRDLWPASSLVQDRGHENIARVVREALKKPDPAAEQASFEARLTMWRDLIDDGVDKLCDPAQMADLDAIVAYLQGQGLDVTLLLYPRKPATLTDKAKATTLARFSDRMRAYAAAHRLRFVDYTLRHPLTDDDFADDFDHILPDGNARLADWALAGELSFLLGADPSAPPGAGGAR